MEEISIASVMTREVTATAAQTPIAEAVRDMRDRRASCVVVTRDGAPVGILTERDVVRLYVDAAGGRLDGAAPVSEYMSSPTVTIGESDTLYEALVVSRAEQVRHLPVVDAGGGLCGLVSQAQLAGAHFHVFEQRRELLERQIEARTRSLQEVNAQLKAMSLEDALMEIGNRRAMEVDLGRTHASARRYQRVYSVLLFDVDHFKPYNDRYGHLAGDEILRRLASHLRGQARRADRLYRYGGEEVLALLPETPAGGAQILARRLVSEIAGLGIPHGASPYGMVTASCGAAVLDGDPSWREVVARADRGLYEAKERGRNRAVLGR